MTVDTLREITRCPVVQLCLDGAKHDCARIVNSQRARRHEFQVPEPWSGHIETAPILFLAANPAFSIAERYPIDEWDDELIADFFINRFGGGREEWTKDRKPLQADARSHAPKAAQTWNEIHNRAGELLDQAARPGVDYAVTDIVHCKSNDKVGVKEAVSFCSKRYLMRVIGLSCAGVIVCIGPETAAAVRDLFGIRDDVAVYGPELIMGRDRCVWFLASPGSKYPRTLSRLPFEEQARLKRCLRASKI